MLLGVSEFVHRKEEKEHLDQRGSEKRVHQKLHGGIFSCKCLENQNYYIVPRQTKSKGKKVRKVTTEPKDQGFRLPESKRQTLTVFDFKGINKNRLVF